jgi:hypothetical protein
MSTTTSNVGLPDLLKSNQPLWETERTQTSNNSNSITRLYENGQIYSWSNTRRIEKKGNLSRVSATYAWRLEACIKPEGIKRVQEILRTQFSTTSPNNPVLTGLDQGIVIWRSYLDGTEHSQTFPASATNDLPELFRDIDYAIQSNIIPNGVPLTQNP